MKRLKKIRRAVFRQEFSEKQMRAYFTKNEAPRKMVMWSSTILGLFSLTLIFFLPSYSLLCFYAGCVFSLIACIAWLSIKFGVHPPTDKEYDVWVEVRARRALIGELRKLNQDFSEDELDQIVFIHGFVLKGTSNAKYYRSQDLFWKRGKDRLQRYSINVFRYFLALRHQLVVITIDINAVNQRDLRVKTHEYFFADVVAVTTEDEQDIFTDDDGSEHAYRTQSFQLRICDGKAVNATIRSQPLDYEEKLETYELPTFEDVEDTIACLRMLIRSHKQGSLPY
ncbi:MAG TPA: hypothetical protein VKV40_22975 [Ktedonobacteraceae bacterium]|nr:hypothetical protein [Ktedonobacteraceae bacterium]